MRYFVKQLILLILINTGIAAFVALLAGIVFFDAFILSQSIGISIYLISWVLSWPIGGRHPQPATYAVAVPIGAVLGISGGSFFIGSSPFLLFRESSNILAVTSFAALVFGIVVSYYFYSRYKLDQAERGLRDENLRREENERRLVEMRLRLLQAQIEPHFLFNTLANVISLIDGDPEKAKMMLEAFTCYLRASLQRTRELQTTLDEELRLVDAYLSIQAVRMGGRLAYTIDCETGLGHLPLPPLLVQPLVENAVKHGLEMKPDQGVIGISVYKKDNDLNIDIRDNGKGFDGIDGKVAGVGIANVRERLQTLYQGGASLDIKRNTPCGIVAKIRLCLPVPVNEPVYEQP